MVSSLCDDADIIKARWLSFENHIHNKCSGHSKLFPNCSHSRPKSTAFSYTGMQCRFFLYFQVFVNYFAVTYRLQLSALHFNENSNREKSLWPKMGRVST